MYKTYKNQMNIICTNGYIKSRVKVQQLNFKRGVNNIINIKLFNGPAKCF